MYQCQVDGRIERKSPQVCDVRWVPADEIAELELEPVWRYWFWRMGPVSCLELRITVCGSMAFARQMEWVASELEDAGHTVEAPVLKFVADGGGDSRVSFGDLLASRGGPAAFPPHHEIWDAKRSAIDEHLKKVRWADAIVVVNGSKNGIGGYIGGNTLLEISEAYGCGTPIFILNPISSDVQVIDEVLGMAPTILDGDLSLLT